MGAAEDMVLYRAPRYQFSLPSTPIWLNASRARSCHRGGREGIGHLLDSFSGPFLWLATASQSDEVVLGPGCLQQAPRG